MDNQELSITARPDRERKAAAPSACVSNMSASAAAQTSALFRTVLNGLPYYNERAKQAETLKYSTEELQRMVEAWPASVLLANINNEPVGFCFLREDDATIWISWIGVHPAQRKKGIARILLSNVERIAREMRSHKVWCDSRTENTASRTLLQTQGYNPICTIRNHWYGQDFLLWEKFVA